jgi:hypothetical protein
MKQPIKNNQSLHILDAGCCFGIREGGIALIPEPYTLQGVANR